jgi:hypothetical protein
MNRDQEFEKECANPLPVKYRATLAAVADLDLLGVEHLKNLKISSQPLLMSAPRMAEFRTFSRTCSSRSARLTEAKGC